MTYKACPMNNFNVCKGCECSWFMSKDDECAIPLIAVFTNNPPKEKDW